VATIGDVAREAGVSRSTVSSVLTGRKLVTPPTRQKIEAAIEKLNFSVNAGARALATSRTMSIGVVVRFHEAEFGPALATYLVDLSDAARGYGYSIVLLTEADGVAAVRRMIAGRQVDGLILLSLVNGDPRLEPIASAGFPAVLIGMPQDTMSIDAVDLDFAAGARMLVDHLVDAGHDDATFVQWPVELYESGATYAVRFADAARKRAVDRGLHLVEQPLPVEPELVRRDLAELVSDPRKPRAMLVHNDTAAAMLPFVLHERGLRIPGDRSVVSLHSAELAQLFALDVTSVASEPLAVSQVAVDLLMRRLNAPGAPAESRLIEPSLILRGSVARPT